MPVILETISWILKNVNVGVDRLIVGYGVRFVYSAGNEAISEIVITRHSPFEECLLVRSLISSCLSCQY